MNIKRVLISGILMWILIFIAFTIMIFIPIIKNSEYQQFILMYLIVVPIVLFSAKTYYKKGNKTNGFLIGLLFVSIALILDIFITVPFTMIPNGGSYTLFFLNPLLWVLIVEIIGISFFYWKIKVK